MNSDYQTISTRDYKEVNAYTATGSSSSVLAARVSYVFNLHGPCLTLDTACSSALIAVHLGSQAIRSGKCELKWIPRILWSHVLAARVSYVFNLHCPCLTLDTACSSALIAVHLGSQAFRSGKCELKWIPRILWSHVLA